MARAEAAQRAAAPKVTASLAALLSPARAEASRRNGARSKGPRTPEGKARSAQNALKHGLRGERYVVLGDEDLAAFDALEAALMAELAPEGVLQAVLARRIVAAAWRLERAERIEAELLAQNVRDTASFGLGLIRDCKRGRAFDTLLRYRRGTFAEFFRALRTLTALQAEAAALPIRAVPGAELEPVTDTRGPDSAPPPSPERPIEPKSRTNPGQSHTDAASAGASPAPGPVGARLAPRRAPRRPPTSALGASEAGAGAPDGAARGPNRFPALVSDPAAPLPAVAPASDITADIAPAARTAAQGDRVLTSPESPIEPKGPTNPGEAAVMTDPPQSSLNQPMRLACRGVVGTLRDHG